MNKIHSADRNWQKKVEDKMGSEAPNKQKDLEPGTFSENPGKIVQELKRKSDDFSHAMSRLQFFINRNGENLDSSDLRRLEQAKDALYRIYGEKPPAKKPIGATSVSPPVLRTAMNLHSIFNLGARLAASVDQNKASSLKKLLTTLTESGLDMELKLNKDQSQLFSPTVSKGQVKELVNKLKDIGYNLRVDQGAIDKANYALVGDGLVLRGLGGGIGLYFEG